MNSSTNTGNFADGPLPSECDIASLAFKFYRDSNFQEGHDYENWLCAEYMLKQKQFIERQIKSFRRLKAGLTMSLAV